MASSSTRIIFLAILVDMMGFGLILPNLPYAEEAGVTLGQSTSLDSITRVLAPTLGGHLIGSLGGFAPEVFAAFCSGWLVLYGMFRLNIRGQAQPRAETRSGFRPRAQVEGSPNV